MLEFKNAIEHGAERRFQEAKTNIKEVAGFRYEEIKNLANDLYYSGLQEQARRFVELAYLHLRNKDVVRYTTVRQKYGALLW